MMNIVEFYFIILFYFILFPVRAHAWAVGQVPCRGHVRGKVTNQRISLTSMFFSLSLSLPSPFSKDKYKK